MPAISVIVPVYNSEKYIEKTLGNILSQTLYDIEVLCVNDGSNDSSLKIINMYKQTDTRVKVLNQINMGAGMARNYGIKNATGEYIAFMDSDDEYPQDDVLEILYEYAINKNILICGGGIIKNNIKIENQVIDWEEGEYSFNDNQCDYWFTRFIYNRKFLLKNNIFFPRSYCYEDPVFLLKAMGAAKKYYLIKKMVYKQNESHTTSGIYSLRQMRDYLKGIKWCLIYSKKNKYNIIYKENIYRFFFIARNRLLANKLYFEDERILRLLTEISQVVNLRNDIFLLVESYDRRTVLEMRLFSDLCIHHCLGWFEFQQMILVEKVYLDKVEKVLICVIGYNNSIKVKMLIKKLINKTNVLWKCCK